MKKIVLGFLSVVVFTAFTAGAVNGAADKARSTKSEPSQAALDETALKKNMHSRIVKTMTDQGLPLTSAFRAFTPEQITAPSLKRFSSRPSSSDQARRSNAESCVGPQTLFHRRLMLKTINVAVASKEAHDFLHLVFKIARLWRKPASAATSGRISSENFLFIDQS
jgi:hypothetical protein